MAAVTEMGRADQSAAHAAAELYEQHSARVFGYCLSQLRRREDAEDATQLTFLHAVRGLRRGVVPAAESAWLFGIARNVCLARWAATGRRSRVEAACDPNELESLAVGRDPHRDELIGLERALELLPEQQRRAVLLRDWRGLSYEEVAASLGVSHAAVETLIFRGRRALAERLEERQPPERRRRLRSLGEIGSLLNAIKGAFTGAATGAKLAAGMAAGVAAVAAASGSGIALGVAADDPVPTRSGAVPQRDAHVAATSTPTMPPAMSTVTRVAGAGRARAASTPTAAPSRATPSPAGDADAPEPSAAAPAPAAERRPDVEAAAPLSTALFATPGIEVPPVAAPAPTVSTPDAPVVEAPLPPPVELPSTETVSAAIDPVVTVVEETTTSLPPPPALPELPAATVPLPPLPAPKPPLP